MRKVGLFYSQKYNDYKTWPAHFVFEKFMRCAKVYGLLFLDCAFRVLIGWAGKLQSHGGNKKKGKVTKETNKQTGKERDQKSEKVLGQ